MRDIPKDILERCEFTTGIHDPTPYIKRIQPLDPCPCGKTLDDIRRVRLQKNSDPVPHWREYCYTCKLVSIYNENTWMKPVELNAIMRSADFNQK